MILTICTNKNPNKIWVNNVAKLLAVILEETIKWMFILLYPLRIDGAIWAFRIALVLLSSPSSSYGVSSVASAFVVMEILMYSSLTAAGVWVAVVSSFVVMPTSYCSSGQGEVFFICSDGWGDSGFFII